MVRRAVIDMVKIVLALMAIAPIRKGVGKVVAFVVAGLLMNLIKDEAVAYLLLLFILPGFFCWFFKAEL